jgi:hypothetical protein
MNDLGVPSVGTISALRGPHWFTEARLCDAMRKKPRTPGVRHRRLPVRRVLDGDGDEPLFEEREPVDGFPADPKELSAARAMARQSGDDLE